VVKVGASTETEMKEKKHRVEDALQAARAALEEGQVPGGGVALINAADAVKEKVLTDLEGDERTGAQIIIRALEEPLRQRAPKGGARHRLFYGRIRLIVEPPKSPAHIDPNALRTTNGLPPIATMPATVFVAGSTSEIVPSPLFGIHSRPSGPRTPSDGLLPTL